MEILKKQIPFPHLKNNCNGQTSKRMETHLLLDIPTLLKLLIRNCTSLEVQTARNSSMTFTCSTLKQKRGLNAKRQVAFLKCMVRHHMFMKEKLCSLEERHTMDYQTFVLL